AVGAGARPANILGRRGHTGVVEALVTTVLVDEAVLGCVVHRRVRQLGAGVALAALTLATEDALALLLAAGHRAHVERRLVRDQERRVGKELSFRLVV